MIEDYLKTGDFNLEDSDKELMPWKWKTQVEIEEFIWPLIFYYWVKKQFDILKSWDWKKIDINLKKLNLAKPPKFLQLQPHTLHYDLGI